MAREGGPRSWGRPPAWGSAGGRPAAPPPRGGRAYPDHPDRAPGRGAGPGTARGGEPRRVYPWEIDRDYQARTGRGYAGFDDPEPAARRPGSGRPATARPDRDRYAGFDDPPRDRSRYAGFEEQRARPPRRPTRVLPGGDRPDPGYPGENHGYPGGSRYADPRYDPRYQGEPGYPGQGGGPRVPPPRAPRPRRTRPARRANWGRRALVLLVVAGVCAVVAGAYVDSHLTRAAALKDYDGRPSTDGTNWLIVGSDSRADLSSGQESELSTGYAAGGRTDTIMLLHTGSSGTTLLSLPRDSLLAIPGHGRNKLNAAFSMGGPSLLVRTVEDATGLRIDDYAEIGFGGFVDVVDAVGGVNMCIPQAMKDPKAGLDLQPGCQTLNGVNALGYVRTRATPRADLDRVEHQREFLSALMKKTESPATLLNPFRMVPLVQAIPGALTVDSSDHVWNLAGLAMAMREVSAGRGVTATVPIGSLGMLNGSSVVRWDTARAKQLFGALAQDQAPPKGSMN
jgi:LCP family protein required for cell wall assembly